METVSIIWHLANSRLTLAQWFAKVFHSDRDNKLGNIGANNLKITFRANWFTLKITSFTLHQTAPVEVELDADANGAANANGTADVITGKWDSVTSASETF